MILTLVGDISLSEIDVNAYKIDDMIIEYLLQSDFTIGNLESPITNCEKKRDFLPLNLKSAQDSISLLKHFSYLNLCNNHIFDFGDKGYLDTIKFLEDNRIYYSGVIKRKTQQNDLPFKININSQEKVCIISATRWGNLKNTEYGTIAFKQIERFIKRIIKEDYFLIYYPHWGYEYITIPPPDVRKHAHKMIDLGVDLIVGTHPHIVQGYEMYKNKYIFYSLGNFIFNTKFNQTAYNQHLVNKSLVLKLSIKNKIVEKFHFQPFEFSEKGMLVNSDVINEKYLIEISKIFNESNFVYKIEYYKQTVHLAKQSAKIRNKLMNQSKKDKKFKSLLYNYLNATPQDIKNRIFALLINKCSAILHRSKEK
ncbi:CapA family protein [bacterium]|nr:CapA family protein [bacterium]